MRYSEKRIEVNPESILKVGRAEYRRPRGRPKSRGKTADYGILCSRSSHVGPLSC